MEDAYPFPPINKDKAKISRTQALLSFTGDNIWHTRLKVFGRGGGGWLGIRFPTIHQPTSETQLFSQDV